MVTDIPEGEDTDGSSYHYPKKAGTSSNRFCYHKKGSPGQRILPNWKSRSDDGARRCLQYLEATLSPSRRESSWSQPQRSPPLAARVGSEPLHSKYKKTPYNGVLLILGDFFVERSHKELY